MFSVSSFSVSLSHFLAHKTRSNAFVRGVVGRRNRSFFDRMTSKRRRNSYSDYERRGSLQRRSIHAQNDPVVPSPADLPVQSTLPSRPLKVSSPHSKRRRFSMSSEKTRRLSASGMIANGARKSLAAIKRLFSVHRGSNYSEEYT